MPAVHSGGLATAVRKLGTLGKLPVRNYLGLLIIRVQVVYVPESMVVVVSVHWAWGKAVCGKWSQLSYSSRHLNRFSAAAVRRTDDLFSSFGAIVETHREVTLHSLPSGKQGLGVNPQAESGCP